MVLIDIVYRITSAITLNNIAGRLVFRRPIIDAIKTGYTIQLIYVPNKSDFVLDHY